MKIERIKCGMVNCWLISGGNGSILVDTAVFHYKDMLYERLKEQNVKLIFLTHGHTDHTGNAAFLAQKLGAKIGMAEADVPLIGEDLKKHPLTADTFLGRMILGSSERSMYKAPRFTPDLFLNDGDTLTEYGAPGAVVTALPGHTAGSLGLLCDQYIIVGDAMFNIMRPTHARLFENGETMLQSTQKILTCGATSIMPGHGRAFPPSALASERTAPID